MAHHIIDLHAFLLKKQIHACLQNGQGCIQMNAHEVCQCEAGIRGAGKKRTSLVHLRDRLTRKIIVIQ